MRNLMQSHRPLTLTCLLVLAACGAGSNTASDSQGLTIHPGGGPTGALAVEPRRIHERMRRSALVLAATGETPGKFRARYRG